MHKFILFLDFDGVLHPRTSGTFRHAPKLAELLAKHPTVQIVISSTWRLQESLTGLRGWFEPALQERIIDDTPEVTPSRGSRQREIELWLRRNPANAWLALDDEAALFDAACPWVYFTNTTEGLTPADLAELDQRLTAARG